jgi:hypothetical protein
MSKGNGRVTTSGRRVLRHIIIGLNANPDAAGRSGRCTHALCTGDAALAAALCRLIWNATIATSGAA